MNLRTSNNAVDYYDWLKTAAIIFVVIDHTGYFFIEDAQWWSVFGRMAAPIFFFLLGYARSRTVPIRWIVLGVVLTILDSWNNEWDWVTLNILFSLAFIRVTRPYVLFLLQKYGWVAFVLIVFVLLAALPIAGDIVDYGAEGWLWGLFGLCHRMYVNQRSSSAGHGTGQYLAPTAHGLTQNWALVRLLACFITALVYVWQEQLEFWFSQPQFITFVVSLGVLGIGLCVFTPGPSRFQPPEPMADVLRFFGRHTLEIYAIQLAVSELIIGLFPELAA